MWDGIKSSVLCVVIQALLNNLFFAIPHYIRIAEVICNKYDDLQ